MTEHKPRCDRCIDPFSRCGCELRLKTLKDIEKTLDSSTEWELISDIKLEAIKWIKSMDGNCEGLEYEKFGALNGQLQDWIKHFFNITEGDLK